MHKTVEDVRKAIGILTDRDTYMVAWSDRVEIASGGMIFHLQNKVDYDTKESIGWYVSGFSWPGD